jgi:predicted dehydrogenase
MAAKQMITDGLIGELFRIHGICSGGDLKDNATHTVDIMRFLYGDRPVVWVIGQIERIGTPMNYDLHPKILRSVTSSLKTMFGASLSRATIPHRVITTSTATGPKAKSNLLSRADRLSVSATRSPVGHGLHRSHLPKSVPYKT